MLAGNKYRNMLAGAKKPAVLAELEVEEMNLLHKVLRYTKTRDGSFRRMCCHLPSRDLQSRDHVICGLTRSARSARAFTPCLSPRSFRMCVWARAILTRVERSRDTRMSRYGDICHGFTHAHSTGTLRGINLIVFKKRKQT